MSTHASNVSSNVSASHAPTDVVPPHAAPPKVEAPSGKEIKTEKQKEKATASTTSPSAPNGAKAAPAPAPPPVDPMDFEKDGGVRINPDFYFYKTQTELEVNGVTQLEKHRLRGYLLGRALRPLGDNDLTDNEKRAASGLPPKPPTYFYVVQLTQPCAVFSHDKERIEGKPGTIVWLDERHNMARLRHLLPRVDDKGQIVHVTEIGVLPTKRVTTSNGFNVWKLELYKWEHDVTTESRLLLASPDIESMARSGSEAAESVEEVTASAEEEIPF
jgi:hypothetical protein